MDIILVMCVGMIFGKWVIPKKWKKMNEKFQLSCTLILIFSMGVMLGQKENFMEELGSLGVVSFIFFLVPTLLSIGVVYYLTKCFMISDNKNQS